MHTPAPIELMNVCRLRDDANRMLVQDRTDPSWPVLCFPGGHVEIGVLLQHDQSHRLSLSRMTGVSRMQLQLQSSSFYHLI